MSQQTDLAFAKPQFDRVVAALRALAGSVSPLEVGENGLGYNNLLYMAVPLSALAEETDAGCACCSLRSPRRICIRSSKTC